MLISRRCCYYVLALIVAFAPPAAAQTWDGGLSHGNSTVNNLWSTPNNWVGGVAPFSGMNTDIVFTQSGLWTTADQNIGTPFILHSLTFTAANTNFNAVFDGPLYLQSNSSSVAPSIIQNSSAAIFVTNPMTLTNSLTVGGAGSGNLTFAGVISGPGGLTMSGAGSLTMTATGSSIPTLTVATGAVTVGGTLSVTGDNFPVNVGGGSSAGTLTISNGAVVNVPSTAVNAGFNVSGAAGSAAVVTGIGSRLNSGSFITVGFGGSGNLTVQNGASIVETGQSLQIASGPGDHATVLIQSGGSMTIPNIFCGVGVGSVATVSVTGAGSSLSSGSVELSVVHGTGSLLASNGGAITIAGAITFGTDPSSITVTGGTLSVAKLIVSGAAGTVLLSDPATGAALTIGTDNSSSTFSGHIADATGGPGTVNKVGVGTLTLTGPLTNSGGYIATNGVIEFSGAVVQTGSGSLMPTVGTTIQYDTGARVFGGFLRGPGSHAVNGATFSGTTVGADAVISQTGTASYVNFTNGGSLIIAGGLATPTVFNGYTNEGSGAITVGAASKVNSAAFQTYGTLTINPATVTENFSQTTLMTNTGTSPLYFNGGSRTFIGTPSTALFPSNWPDASLRGMPTFVAGIDLNGKNAVVAGGLFVNNGYVEDSSNNFTGTSTIIADFGSLVKGAGFFQNTVQTVNGGKFQAGNSPGKATFGKFVFGPGGVSNYVFAIDDATGAAGPTPDALGLVSGWGLVKVIAPPVIDRGLNKGDFVWTATPADRLTVAVETLLNPTTVGVDVPGMMDHFDPTRSYAWPAVEWTGSYAGPADAATLLASTGFDTSGFANPVTGTFGWSLDTAEHSLSLTYTPSAVPEPGTLALTALAGLGWALRRRR